MKTKSGTAVLLAALLGVLACARQLRITPSRCSSTARTASITVRGTVTEFNFKNPHGVIRVNVKDKSGAVEEWKAETNSPSILERRGWKKDSLKVGDEIVIEGWRARDGANYMRMRKVTRADGTPVGIPFESLEVK